MWKNGLKNHPRIEALSFDYRVAPVVEQAERVKNCERTGAIYQRGSEKDACRFGGGGRGCRWKLKRSPTTAGISPREGRGKNYAAEFRGSSLRRARNFAAVICHRAATYKRVAVRPEAAEKPPSWMSPVSKRKPAEHAATFGRKVGPGRAGWLIRFSQHASENRTIITRMRW